MNDLAVYRVGSQSLRHGRALYSVTGPEHLPFTYPPFAAVILAPFAALPWSLDRLAITVVTVGCYLLCIGLVIRRLEVEGSPYPRWWLPVLIAIAIWLEPFRSTVSFGQVNVALMAMILLDLLWIRTESRRGWLIGIAAAIKLTPLAFVPYLFVTGRIRAGVNAIAGFVAAGVVGFAVDPGGSREYWGQRLFLEPRRVGRVENASNQTVRGILARGLHTSQVPSWWLVVAGAVYLAGLIIAVRLYRDDRMVASVTVMAVAMLCASPISWSHHWVWSAPMLALCGELVRRNRASWWALPAAVALMAPFLGLVFLAPHDHGHELSDTMGQQLISATYVIAGVALAAVLAATPARLPWFASPSGIASRRQG